MPTPIAQLDRRLTEQGRIRLGAKVKANCKSHAEVQPGCKWCTRPISIDTFRFTSHDRQAIDNLAAAYGGTVEEFAAGRGQWEVITEANEVDVVLLPDALNQSYELWSGGGCLRRCDGVTVKTPQQASEDEWDWAESPCICIAKDAMECKLKTRLTVMLPAVRFGGGWRLETSSVNAAVELREMVNNIQALAATGLTRAKLALEQRQSKSNGKTKNFVVPVLRVDHSLDDMLAGAAALRAPDRAPALEASTSPPDVEDELAVGEGEAPAATTTPEDATDDEEVLDVEVVHDGERNPQTNARFHTIIKDMGLDYERFVKPYLKHRFDGRSWSELTEAERESLVDPLMNGFRGRSASDMRALFATKVREVQ